MTFADLDWVSVALRMAVYVGTIASAGGVFVCATLDTKDVSNTVNGQIGFGILLLLICEPIRYIVFQLSIAQGDWSIAFDPTMRWMGMETPLGQAAIVRLVSAALVLVGFAWLPLAVIGGLLMVGSYLLEGHTASSENRLLLALILFIHLAVVHWWLGALLPLRSALESEGRLDAARLVKEFDTKAPWLVAALFLAGTGILAALSGWKINLSTAYQQGFVLKLFAFTAILSIAATNKFWWTPLLARDPEKGRRGLRSSIRFELSVAAAILFATAIATSFPPEEH